MRSLACYLGRHDWQRAGVTILNGQRLGLAVVHKRIIWRCSRCDLRRGEVR